MSDIKNEYLTVDEIAEILRVERITASRIVRKEKLGFKVGKKVLIKRKDLQVWLDEKSKEKI